MLTDERALELWRAGDFDDSKQGRVVRFARAIEAEVLQAQEPVAWTYTINKSHSIFSAEKPPEDAYDEGTLYPLYDAPQPPVPCPKCAKLEEENRKAQQEIAGDIVTIRKCDNLLKLSRAKVAEQAAEIERQTDFANNFAAQVRQQNETIASLRAEVDHRQSLLRESNRNCAEHAGVVWTQNATIAQQSERIAELGRREFDWARSNAKCTDHISAQAALIEKCEKALLSAQSFIRNGVELGFIRMPDKDVPDPAHQTPGKIDEAIAAIDAQKGGAR